MTKRLIILTLAAIGAAWAVKLLRPYFNRVLEDLDRTMVAAHAPLTDPGFPEMWSNPHAWVNRVNRLKFNPDFNPHVYNGKDVFGLDPNEYDNIAPVYGYQNFNHGPVPGSAEAFRAAWPGRRDDEMGR